MNKKKIIYWSGSVIFFQVMAAIAQYSNTNEIPTLEMQALTLTITVGVGFLLEILLISIRENFETFQSNLQLSVGTTGDVIKDEANKIQSGLNNTRDEIKSEINEAVDSLLGRESNIAKVEDSVLRDILVEEQKDIEGNINNVVQHDNTITIQLNRLWEYAEKFLRASSEVRAVEVDIIRWVRDARAASYVNSHNTIHANKNLIRIFTVGRNVTKSDFDAFVNSIRNETKDYRVIFYKDIVPAKYRAIDFAIYHMKDNGHVLLTEEFHVENWITASKGDISTCKEKLKKHEEIFTVISDNQNCARISDSDFDEKMKRIRDQLSSSPEWQ
ncbi:hypothetical protein HBA55_33955 [Pseudomaricurvus alkylphenolicus]|uniref:hypothetical protein n=1 Tax=Pseudomaricurvus alkylphenolicus TaxID=1306991 RepID=UPI00141E050C|nr:hypothetical protein [Pseudomaricurvus alkylphenolicus]NIB44637.1 hypothetical protein [Pseudomaricurvus alkylphenolicus]